MTESQQPAATPPPETPRRLYRSRSDRMLAGVAGGIANHFGLDPTLIRLAWLLLVIFGGGGIIAYVIAWILIPEEPGGDIAASGPTPAATAARRQDPGAAALIVGGILIATGVAALLGPVTATLFRFAVPAALIIVGIAIIAKATQR